MDLNALLEPIVAFSSDGDGAVIAQIFRAVFELLYPSNAEAPHQIATDTAAAISAAK